MKKEGYRPYRSMQTGGLRRECFATRQRSTVPVQCPLEPCRVAEENEKRMRRARCATIGEEELGRKGGLHHCFSSAGGWIDVKGGSHEGLIRPSIRIDDCGICSCKFHHLVAVVYLFSHSQLLFGFVSRCWNWTQSININWVCTRLTSEDARLIR